MRYLALCLLLSLAACHSGAHAHNNQAPSTHAHNSKAIWVRDKSHHCALRFQASKGDVDGGWDYKTDQPFRRVNGVKYYECDDHVSFNIYDYEEQP